MNSQIQPPGLILFNMLIIAAIIFIDLLTGMEFDLFVPSFSQLQNHFNLTAFWVEALLSVNFVGYCIGLFIVGHFADRYKRKPIILLGLLIFILGSIFCVTTDSFGFILMGRFLQGIGIAAPSILSFLIIADRYSLQKQQSLMAMLNGSMNIAAGVAPVMGSFIALYFQWKGNFIALLLLGLIALVMTLIFIPTYQQSKLESLNWREEYKSVFQHKPVMFLMATLVIMFVPYWLFVGISPLLYVKTLHVSYPQFGLYQGILAFTFAIGSILFGVVIHRQSQKKWLLISLGIFVFALLMIGGISITNNLNPNLMTLSMLVFVIGQIIPTTILYPICLNILPHAKAKISAIMQAVRLIISALSLEVVGYFYHGTFQFTGFIIVLFIFMIIVTQYCVIKKL